MKDLDKILKETTIPNDDDCWIYNRSVDSNGYPKFYSDEDKKTKAILGVIYNYYHGSRKIGERIYQKCNIKRCINPKHLEAGISKRATTEKALTYDPNFVLKEITVLNLGAGVQSTAMALMYCKGILTPIPDAIMFADTGWEPEHIYKHVWWLAEQFEIYQIPFYIVSNGSLKDHIKSRPHFSKLPLSNIDLRNGKSGMTNRICTNDFKIKPLDRKCKELLGLKDTKPIPPGFRVNKLIGISTDEASRIKPSENPSFVNKYPLCNFPEGSGIEMSREDCIAWLKENYPEVTPAKSSCLGCPFKSQKSWAELKRNGGREWDETVEIDELIRNASNNDNYRYFLNSKCIPLKNILVSEEDDLDLFDNECTGTCNS